MSAPYPTAAWLSRSLTALALTALPVPAFAHSGGGAHADFASGLLHPYSGVDHLLVMLAVGILAWMLGGKARWVLPLSFVSVMAASAWVSANQLPVPGVELAIALSVSIMGLLIARGMTLSIAAALPLIALFAVFHGLAHGTEMPISVSGITYGTGFVVGTAMLHGLGLFCGMALAYLGQTRDCLLIRVFGAGMSVSGVVLLVGALAA